MIYKNFRAIAYLQRNAAYGQVPCWEQLSAETAGPRRAGDLVGKYNGRRGKNWRIVKIW